MNEILTIILGALFVIAALLHIWHFIAHRWHMMQIQAFIDAFEAVYSDTSTEKPKRKNDDLPTLGELLEKPKHKPLDSSYRALPLLSALMNEPPRQLQYLNLDDLDDDEFRQLVNDLKLYQQGMQYHPRATPPTPPPD